MSRADKGPRYTGMRSRDIGCYVYDHDECAVVEHFADLSIADNHADTLNTLDTLRSQLAEAVGRIEWLHIELDKESTRANEAAKHNGDLNAKLSSSILTLRTAQRSRDEAVGLLRSCHTVIEEFIPDHLLTNPDHVTGATQDRIDAFLTSLDATKGGKS